MIILLMLFILINVTCNVFSREKTSLLSLMKLTLIKDLNLMSFICKNGKRKVKGKPKCTSPTFGIKYACAYVQDIKKKSSAVHHFSTVQATYNIIHNS